MLSLLLACSSPTPDSGQAPRQDLLRIATWNVQGLGLSGGEELADARTVMLRLDADVLALNEIDEGEDEALRALGEELGYAVLLPETNDFGPIRNAILTRLEVAASQVHTSAQITGLTHARELTRWVPELRVVAPESGLEISVLGLHLKSGFDNDDAFRRTIDAVRVGQAAGQARVLVGGRVVVLGDFNEQVRDVPGDPALWTESPSGLPSSYELGSDLELRMRTDGVVHDPFIPLTEGGLSLVQAAKNDGDFGTRPDSGRRIDYIFAGAELQVQGAMVYDCKLEHLEGGLDLAGEAPGRGVCEDASDHLPVVVDLVVGG